MNHNNTPHEKNETNEARTVKRERDPDREPGPVDSSGPEHTPGTSRDWETGVSRERDPPEPPRIWVGSLADYTNGVLHGEWIDATLDDEDILATIRAMLERSEQPGAEEWAIFDHDGFAPYAPGEYEDITTVARVARGIADHGPAFAAWAHLNPGDRAHLDRFEDAYLGDYDTTEAWAEECADDWGFHEQIEHAVNTHLAPYVRFDAEAFARDAWLGGDITSVDKPGGGVWVFRAD